METANDPTSFLLEMTISSKFEGNLMWIFFVRNREISTQVYTLKEIFFENLGNKSLACKEIACNFVKKPKF